MSTKKAASQPQSHADGTLVFQFRVSAADVARESQHVLEEMASTAELKGFRKGKAPISLVQKSLDQAKFKNHVLEHVLPQAYQQAIQDNKYEPIIEPRITPLSLEDGQDWEFRAETASRPPMTLGDYKKYITEALRQAPKPAPDVDPKSDPKLTLALDTLLKNAQISVSPLLVEEEAKTALSRLLNQLSALKLTVDDYAKSLKKSRDELVAEYQKTAEINLKVEFLVSEIIRDLNPAVTDAEVAALKPAKGQESYARYLVQKKKVLDFISGL